MNVWKFISGLCIVIGVVLAVVLAWGAVFRPVLEDRSELEAKKAELEAKVVDLEAQLKELRENQARLEADPRFVEKVAREDLGYAKPGETVFRFVEDKP